MADDAPFVERRKPDPQIEFLSDILKTVQKLNEKFEAMQGVRTEITEIRHAVDDLAKAEAEMCKCAFPGGDPDGHRRAHEAQIKSAERRAEFWARMAAKAGEMTVYGFIACLTALVAYFWNGHMPSASNLIPPK